MLKMQKREKMSLKMRKPSLSRGLEGGGGGWNEIYREQEIRLPGKETFKPFLMYSSSPRPPNTCLHMLLGFCPDGLITLQVIESWGRYYRSWICREESVSSQWDGRDLSSVYCHMLSSTVALFLFGRMNAFLWWIGWKDNIIIYFFGILQ